MHATVHSIIETLEMSREFKPRIGLLFDSLGGLQLAIQVIEAKKIWEFPKLISYGIPVPDSSMEIYRFDHSDWENEVDLLVYCPVHASDQYILDNIANDLLQRGLDHAFEDRINLTSSQSTSPFIVKYRGIPFKIDQNTFRPSHYSNMQFINHLNNLIKTGPESTLLLDMCSGQGSVGISTFLENPNIEKLILGEIDKKQISAIKNTHRFLQLGDSVIPVHTDCFANIGENLKFDYIVANPPHQDRKTVTLQDLRGADPNWSFHRKLLSECNNYLSPNGVICLLENGRQSYIPLSRLEDIVKKENPSLYISDCTYFRGSMWYVAEIRLR